MTDEEFIARCNSVYVEVFKETLGRVPRDTGNLQMNGIEIQFPEPKTCVISINEEIAPYVFFTNEKWIASKWKCKQNKNEAWWQRIVQYFVEQLAIKLNGVINDKPEND